MYRSIYRAVRKSSPLEDKIPIESSPPPPAPQTFFCGIYDIFQKRLRNCFKHDMRSITLIYDKTGNIGKSLFSEYL